ncbi:hypothetical protein FCH31_14365 [Lelliottia amnigena]|uniref:SMP-30/gluconolactonase/LRE family protein n=1 Tax=Lelliottia amnigena TaxID=61646 RepID=UPI0020C640B4|nr:SMP-30/gluconolactonase/LRE family protein [Lelliottia amnigena]NTX70598.1 hypothetical protein [Lelliottia amnigena]
MTDYIRNIVNNQNVTSQATLIRGATILSMDENVGNIERGDILINGSTITAVGQNLDVSGAHVIDATNMIAIPGMVDSHRHAWEGQLRRINPNATCLDDYSNATHFSFAKYYRPADIYVGNLLTALGAIDAGITTMIDNSHNSRSAAHSDAAVEALLDTGIRAIHASGAPVAGEWDRGHWPGNWQRLQDKYFTNNPESLVSLAVMAQLEPELMCCDYPSLQNQHVFAESEGSGAPDGSCVDEMGYLWNAEWGGNRVVRYRPDGTTDAILTSPGIQSTCPTLAGEGFTRLYCTTAAVGLTALSEYDGALLKAKSDLSPGLPENRFAAHTV